MPIYEYRCPNCNATNSEFRPIDQRDHPTLGCSACATPDITHAMQRTISAPYGIVAGGTNAAWLNR